MSAAALSPSARALMARVLAPWAPRPAMPIRRWAERYRYVARGAYPGPWRSDVVPYLVGVLDAITEPGIREVVAMKASQVGWTDSVAVNTIAWAVHTQASPVLVVFPTHASARKFSSQVLDPVIASTPVLAERLPPLTRTRGESWDVRSFPGGHIAMVGSQAPSSTKSHAYRYVLVEEPDDTALDAGGQGSAISLARLRTKSYGDAKILIGGTPGTAGLSQIEDALERSDLRLYQLECPDCGDEHPASMDWWTRVTWETADDGVAHPVWGMARPETARYMCPACGSPWDDRARLAAASRPDAWRASRPTDRTAGFYLPELLSRMPESRLELLVQDHLQAERALRSGSSDLARAFHTQRLGVPWQLSSELPDAEALIERGEAYEVGSAPDGALIVTAGVDVQHDRLHVGIYGWGRGEECWLLERRVIWGTVIDTRDPAWRELDVLLGREIPHASGAALACAAVSIDSGDGQTADAVYAYVRQASRRARRRTLAVKGSSQRGREIFTPPRPVDTNRLDKAARYGLRSYPVGVDRAKDTILERLKLTGRGPGRRHWPRAIDDDYFEQLVSEVRAPGRGGLVWTLRAGRRNEDLDAAVYALHAARALRIHQWSEDHWRERERQLQQRDLFSQAPPAAPSAAESAQSETAPARRRFGFRVRR